ncbi:branched-chain amino acid ABC transporter permease [Microbacterium sp. A93]|uniref:branched-chain amino acid ABC transporter permease n=1 Tax=Microbacterium sp. A93 TaxID=3450716 RepID=UPI003F4236FE
MATKATDQVIAKAHESPPPAPTHTRAAIGEFVRNYRTLIVVGLLLVLPLFIPVDEQYNANLWAAMAIMALSVVVVTGGSGQVTLGHAGLMAVGAYGAAIASTKLDLPQPLPLFVALGAATLVGTLLAFVCLRLNGIYLAVVTLAFGWAVPELVMRFEGLTDGYRGLFPGPIMIGDTEITSGLPGVYFGVIGVIIAFVLASNMLGNWSGLNVLAVKQSEILAGAFGVVPARQRIWAFVVSSFLAGLGGYIYTFSVGAVTPSSFTFDNSIAFLSAAVIGGVVSPIGALIGAAFVSVVPNLLASSPEVASIAYGVLLFAALGLRSAFRQFSFAGFRKKKSKKGTGL